MGYIISSGKQSSSEEVMGYAAKAASGFIAEGIAEKDTIALCLRNDAPFLVASIAANMMGACPVAMNWHSTIDEASYLLQDSQAKLLIIHADILERIREAVPANVKVLVVETSDEIRNSYDLPITAGKEIPSDAVDWYEWVEAFDPFVPQGVIPFATMIYTSGTTGRPKGVRRTTVSQAQAQGMLQILFRLFGFAGYEENPSAVTTMVTGPMYHSAPNAYSSMALRFGANVILSPRFDAEELLKMIEKHKVTHLHMVPIMFVRLLRLPDDVKQRYDLSSLQYVVHAAAPCPVPVKRKMLDWWGPIIHEYYGSTETGNVTTCNSEQWLSHPGTVGNPLPEVTVRVVNEEGLDMPPHQVGHVGIKSECFGHFTYQGDEEKRRRTEKFGLVMPGDMGYFDENGFLYLCDRSKDMIISGGVNIYPAEIEAELLKLPGIADCAVFGIPDEEYGESVCAYLQPMPGTELDTTVIARELRQHLAGFKVPRVFEVRDELPREDSGKIFKRKLRELYWANTDKAI